MKYTVEITDESADKIVSKEMETILRSSFGMLEEEEMAAWLMYKYFTSPLNIDRSLNPQEEPHRVVDDPA